MTRIFPLVILLTSLLPCLASASGISDSHLDLLKTLKDNGTISTDQYEQLSNTVSSDDADRSRVDGHSRQGRDATDTSPRVESEGGLEIASNDGAFSFELGGRLMVDAAFYDEDQVMLGDGTELRRARIETEGTLFNDYGYEFEIDFSDSSADIKDAYISYQPAAQTVIKVGQTKEPFSLEEMTSSKYITFMERALPNEFAPGRNIGLSLRTEWDKLSAAIGIFGEEFDSGEDSEDDEGWGATARFTWAPVQKKTRALHFGASFAMRYPDDSKEVKFNARPESHLTDIKYLHTGDIVNVDRTLSYALEAAGVYGPFSLQGEFIQTGVDRTSNLDDPTFSGWYVYSSWFVTGESRRYKHSKGAFSSIKPFTPSGAIEFAVRYSVLDLNDGLITGGKEENLTFGLNWYLNKNVRLMVNYLMVDNDDFADADGDVIGNDDPSVLQTRFQMHF